jgi:type III secretion system (T3SS) SseB-like protein
VPGLNLAGPRYRDDDGAAGPVVAAALAAYADGTGSEHAALTALAAARLLVPVVAVTTDGASEMALPTVVGRDGRAAVPAFTCLDSMRRWQPDARPVPVPAEGVWQAAAQEGAAVIDLAGPVPLAVDGARLAALAAGTPVPRPDQDPEVAAVAAGVMAAEPAVAGYRLLPAQHGGDLGIEVTLAVGRGAGTDRARAAIARCAETIMARAGGRTRRGIELTVAAHQAGKRPE